MEKLNKEDDGEEGEREEDEGDQGDWLQEHMEDGDGDFLEKEQLWTMIAQEEPSLLRQIGHQFEDFVIRCTFRAVYYE